MNFRNDKVRVISRNGIESEEGGGQSTPFVGAGVDVRGRLDAGIVVNNILLSPNTTN